MDLDPYRIEYLPNPYYLDDGLISNDDVKIRCGNKYCNCHPFVCYTCKVCKERWWTHCVKGYPPRGVCISCYKSQREITNWTLTCKISKGELTSGSKEWWDIFTKGIEPNFYCYHPNEPKPFVAEITESLCRKLISKVRCDVPEIKHTNWRSYFTRQDLRRRVFPPEEHPCCREDGTPRGSKHPSRRARQRERRLWRKEPSNWSVAEMLAELPRDW